MNIIGLIELDNIYNMDCLEGMSELPTGHKYCIVTGKRMVDYAVEKGYETEADIPEEEVTEILGWEERQ